MKLYDDISWLKDQIKQGLRNKDIARICSVSEFTISSRVSNMFNNMNLNELVSFLKTCVDTRQLLSPRTSAYHLIVSATNFLPTSASLQERLWFLTNNTTTPPTCKCCSSVVSWDSNTRNFRTFCSAKCQGRDVDVLRKRENTNLLNNGVQHPASSDSINQKRKQTLLERYGVNHQNQRHIPQTSLATLNDSTQLELLSNNYSTFEIADMLKVSQSAVSKYLRSHEIISPRKPSSGGERDVLKFIQDNYDGEIICNSRQIIPPQEIDIYLPAVNLAFEFNGLYWHSELAGKNKFYHINKTQMCEKKGIRLIHIFEHKWKDNPELIKSRIKNLLKQPEHRIYARKCSIVTVPTTTARDFFNDHHIQSFSSASVYLGLEFENELVCVMSFGKSRYTSKFEYELIRFCSKRNYSVVGGASKLFKAFVKMFNPKSVITYSDKTWNTGNVYETMGFTFSHNSDPNYYYFDSLQNTYSRVKFQKHKLKNMLTNFDPTLTEWENMKNNGYNRIWDCGNGVFHWFNHRTVD